MRDSFAGSILILVLIAMIFDGLRAVSTSYRHDSVMAELKAIRVAVEMYREAGR